MPKKNIVRGVWDGTMHTGLRRPEDVDTIVIHHAPPTAPIEIHAKNHAKKWGAGCCYHIMINPEQIVQTNDLMSFTFHCGGHNTYTVGICINRDLREGDLTENERLLLYGAIMSVKEAIPTIKYIKGHNELVATECPVTNVDRIRQDIAALEEQLHYVEKNAPNEDHINIARMLNRIIDLKGKYEGKGEFQDEARRKLLLVHQSLTELEFYK
jgi:hypothetical protein